jgi:hypothetical protein
MKQESKEPSSQKLLGYFILMSGCSSCMIFDWGYGSWCLDYLGDTDDDYQIAIPTKHSESGYILAAVQHPIELIDEQGNRVDPASPIDPEIPVYAEYEGDSLKRITIEIELLTREKQNLTTHLEEPGSPNKSSQLTRNLLGCVTSTGGAVVICDMDMVKLCIDCADYDSQITDEMDGEDPSLLRTGVQVSLPIDDIENPVYGEYEGELLKRITLEIANANSC